MATKTVFIYDDMQQGFPNHVMIESARLIGKARLADKVPYSLFDCEGRAVMMETETQEGSVPVGELYELSGEQYQSLIDRAGVPLLFFRNRVTVEVESKTYPAIMLVATQRNPIHESMFVCGRTVLATDGSWLEHSRLMENANITEGFTGTVYRMNKQGRDLGPDAQMSSQKGKDFLLGDVTNPAHYEANKADFVAPTGTLTRSGDRQIRRWLASLKKKIETYVGETGMAAGWAALEPTVNDFYTLALKTMTTAGGAFEKDDRFIRHQNRLMDIIGSKLLVMSINNKATTGSVEDGE